ncbi:MAG: hypothetical protein KGI58_02320 [Patescibacteria group bacterium]|nr:hypothetical protein [Patescibacteria group bacterium]
MDMQNQSTNQPEKKALKFIHVAIIAAIVIVLNLFSNYTASLVFKEPVRDEFIPQTQVVGTITTKDKCISVGGQWNENIFPTEKGQTMVSGSCDQNYTNNIKYNKAHVSYEKKVFITLIVFGVLLLVLAGFISVQILSISFAWGGVLSLLIASMRYWSLADNLFKVVILGLALSLLIWLAIKKFNK